MEHKQFMGEIKAYMMKMIKYAVICIIILGIFGNIAGAQPYIRVYDVIGGQLYGQLEDYSTDSTNCVTYTASFSGSDTLTPSSCNVQLYMASSAGVRVVLPATGFSDGDYFIIKNTMSSTPENYINVFYQGSDKDKIYGLGVKRYIFLYGAWSNYDNGSGSPSGLQSTVFGKNAVGYDNGTAFGVSSRGDRSGAAFGEGAAGQVLGAALGRYSNGSTLGVGVGYQSNGSNNGVAIGYQSYGISSSVSIGYQSGLNSSRGNNLFIENSSDTTTPLIYGEFDTDYIKINDSLAVNSLSGTGNRVVLSGSDGQLISGDTVTAYTMPSGTLSQTLRHDGTNWVANDIFRISDTPNLTFIGSGSVERLKINPGGEIITNSMVGTGVRNVVVDATGELKAGFGSYSVAVVQGTADTNSTTTLSNTSLSYTISDDETWVADIYLYITKIDTSAANIKIQIQKTSGALISAISQVSVSYLNYNTGVSPMTNSFVRDLSASAFVYNLQSGNTEATIIKIRSVLINDANAGTVIVKFAPTTAGLLLQVDKSSNLTATKVQ